MGKRLQNPAVVVDSEAGGIGIIHALGPAGVDMIAVERNWPPLLGRFSRFPKLHVSYQPARADSLVETLLALAERFDGTGVLYASTDLPFESIVAARERLSARYHVPAAPHIGMRIFEKNWQYELAERTGCPIPRHTRFVSGTTPDLAGFRFPLIIKPSARTVAAGDLVFRLQILENDAALARCLAEIAQQHPGREFQIAENIPGEPDQLYTIGAYSDRSGKVLRSYSGRKITQYPYFHGVASVAETVSVPPSLVETARALLEAAGFHGISQVEFKYDPRDGQYKLIEINGRSWLWVKLAAFSGVNLPLIQYYDLTGDPRLADALAVPQDDAHFFVYDAHVKLNRMPAERARIEELRRTKTMVPAIFHPGERRLGLAYRVRSWLKQARRSVTDAPLAAGRPRVPARQAS